jgi:3',5'-cyclic AMP phosphodiesterase CpdA
MAARHTSIETRYLAEREDLYRALGRLDRRSFLKVSAAAIAAAGAHGVVPHSFQPVRVAMAQGAQTPASTMPKDGFRFAYISDSHLYEKKLNDRFVNALMRAVDDVNRMIPQPDFVLYGGDLAQLGQVKELTLGAEILKGLKAPVRMMVGEHDWYLDMGEKWQELFGQPTYSFDHKGVHFIVLNSVLEKDFWTARRLTPMERMQIVAGLDNSIQSRFEVGEAQRRWLEADVRKVPQKTPLVVFSHSPLYKLYEPWNFWTADAEEVQRLFKGRRAVTVVHGHTHQLLTHRIGNIHFHGMLSTAWPWPYAPEGMPELTIQMGRPDPLSPNDGCGDGSVKVHPDGLVDKIYDLWNRNAVTIRKTYVATGKLDKPAQPRRRSY